MEIWRDGEARMGKGKKGDKTWGRSMLRSTRCWRNKRKFQRKNFRTERNCERKGMQSGGSGMTWRDGWRDVGTVEENVEDCEMEEEGGE